MAAWGQPPLKPVLPNDQYLQWYHWLPAYGGIPATNGPLHTPLAWTITTGSSNVVVGIIDSGIDERLFEFAGRLVPGWNFVGNNAHTHDSLGRGTAVASVLGANANNPHPSLPGQRGLFGAGVDWQCKLMPIKVLGPDDTMRESWAARGIEFAAERGCKVILFTATARQSLSAGASVAEAIGKAIDRGAIFVCSAGDAAQRIAHYPPLFEPAIAVGSTTKLYPGGLDGHRYFTLSSYSNYGPELDIVAPGDILALFPRDDSPEIGAWGGAAGTAASAAMVAGVCSLMAAVRPDLTHEQARVLLGAGADDQGGDQRDTPGYDIYYGWGRLNAYNSLVLATTRIDRFERNRDGTVELSWVSPPNAASKRPYAVEAAPAVTGPWTAVGGKLAYEYKRTVTEEGVSSESYRTVWTSGRLDPELRYFRVRITLNE